MLTNTDEFPIGGKAGKLWCELLKVSGSLFRCREFVPNKFGPLPFPFIHVENLHIIVVLILILFLFLFLFLFQGLISRFARHSLYYGKPSRYVSAVFLPIFTRPSDKLSTGIQQPRSFPRPRRLTGANSMKFPDTTSTSTFWSACGQLGMRICRTMFSPLASCRS